MANEINGKKDNINKKDTVNLNNKEPFWRRFLLGSAAFFMKIFKGIIKVADKILGYDSKRFRKPEIHDLIDVNTKGNRNEKDIALEKAKQIGRSDKMLAREAKKLEIFLAKNRKLLNVKHEMIDIEVTPLIFEDGNKNIAISFTMNGKKYEYAVDIESNSVKTALEEGHEYEKGMNAIYSKFNDINKIQNAEKADVLKYAKEKIKIFTSVIQDNPLKTMDNFEINGCYVNLIKNKDGNIEVSIKEKISEDKGILLAEAVFGTSQILSETQYPDLNQFLNDFYNNSTKRYQDYINQKEEELYKAEKVNIVFDDEFCRRVSALDKNCVELDFFKDAAKINELFKTNSENRDFISAEKVAMLVQTASNQKRASLTNSVPNYIKVNFVEKNDEVIAFISRYDFKKEGYTNVMSVPYDLSKDQKPTISDGQLKEINDAICKAQLEFVKDAAAYQIVIAKHLEENFYEKTSIDESLDRVEKQQNEQKQQEEYKAPKENVQQKEDAR